MSVLQIADRIRPDAASGVLLTAVILGGVSALGGGMVRDAMLTHVPAALHTEMCAVAVLTAACFVVRILAEGSTGIYRFRTSADGAAH